VSTSNDYTTLDAYQSTLIEPNVMIGPHTYITDADHGLQKKQPIKTQPMVTRPACIEQDYSYPEVHFLLPRNQTHDIIEITLHLPKLD
jgi:hypothetical protein